MVILPYSSSEIKFTLLMNGQSLGGISSPDFALRQRVGEFCTRRKRNASMEPDNPPMLRYIKYLREELWIQDSDACSMES